MTWKWSLEIKSRHVDPSDDKVGFMKTLRFSAIQSQMNVKESPTCVLT